jgi:hypothetical protein
LRFLGSLQRRADQVSDDNECAHANESRQADRKQKPDKFNLLGVEVKDAHCSSTRQLRLRPVIQRDIAMERRPPGAEWWPIPRFYLSS